MWIQSLFLGIWVTRWMECWQDLPADPKEASSEVGYASYDAWMLIYVYHNVQSMLIILMAALIQGI